MGSARSWPRPLGRPACCLGSSSIDLAARLPLKTRPCWHPSATSSQAEVEPPRFVERGELWCALPSHLRSDPLDRDYTNLFRLGLRSQIDLAHFRNRVIHSG